MVMRVVPFDLPTRGYVVLWTVALAGLGTGAAEIAAMLRRGR